MSKGEEALTKFPAEEIIHLLSQLSGLLYLWKSFTFILWNKLLEKHEN